LNIRWSHKVTLFSGTHRHTLRIARRGKGDFMYQATVDVASIRIWLRDPFHDLRNTA
jgi:hypothetical protein